jgi:hypothetical protein
MAAEVVLIFRRRFDMRLLWTLRDMSVVRKSVLGFATAGIIMASVAGVTSQVSADDCPPNWTGSPTGEPSVTWECDPHLKYIIHPVAYTQTNENPCEGETDNDRDCSYSYEFVRISEDGYVFRKTDSCRTLATPPATVPEETMQPTKCCLQSEVPPDEEE